MTPEGPMRFFSDFFSYLIFLGSAYVMFATNFYLRYLLIPITIYAFFHTISNNFRRGVLFAKNSTKEDLDNIVSGDVEEKD
jgi:hypothetical protein